MKTIILILILIQSTLLQSQNKIINWSAYAIAGTLWGAREAYHADPYVFETKFNASPTSFFGSKAWLRNYHNLNVAQGHKPEVFNTFRDYWHFSGTTSKLLYIGASFNIGRHKENWKQLAFELGTGWLISVSSAAITYNLLR